MKKRYWAVGINSEYDILESSEHDSPDSSDWGSFEGPFKNYTAALKQALYWIKCDRKDLSYQRYRLLRKKTRDS